MTSEKSAGAARRFTLDERSMGVLLHPTSLPGRFPGGDLGRSAREAVDYLASAGVRWWQMLPLGPVGPGSSPYSSTSVFAGSPWLVDLERLANEGMIELPEGSAPTPRVDYGENGRQREALLAAAFEKAKPAGWHLDERRAFFEEEAWWLGSFALYSAIKKSRGGEPFFAWPEPLKKRDDGALAEFARTHADDIELEIFIQYLFARDLADLHAYANERGVALMGDLPIFVAHDSSDVWAQPEVFQIDERGELRAVAGVPPDAFSDEGQLWGNPLYDWDHAARTGYRFWIERLRHAMRGFDSVRLDHFIGFQRYWAVPLGAKTAKSGAYMKGPGRALFQAIKGALGDVPLVAEDLGVLTDEVRALRDGLGMPGMNVLQFSFHPSAGAEPSRPHRYVKRSVVYTGTHDNDTLVGWLSGPPDSASKEAADAYASERAFALEYLAIDPKTPAHEQARAFVRAALMNQADLAIIPAQDLIGLGREARMNRPGVTDGNWAFRLMPEQLGPETAAWLAKLGATYGRTPRK